MFPDLATGRWILMAIYIAIIKMVKLFLPSTMFEKDITGQVVLITGGGFDIGGLMCLT